MYEPILHMWSLIFAEYAIPRDAGIQLDIISFTILVRFSGVETGGLSVVHITSTGLSIIETIFTHTIMYFLSINS